MKTNILKHVFSVIALISISLVSAQSDDQNYVQSTTCLDADCIKKAITVEYLDGLGRTKQIVNVKASPAGNDVVTHVEYDGFGRQVKDFLPVPQSGTLNGNIIPNPLVNATQPSIYGSERIFAEKKIENSPLDRLQEQTRVGTAWANKPVKYDYAANNTAEIRKYVALTNTVEGITNSTIKVADDPASQNGFYKEAVLYKNKVTDEDGNVTYEFLNSRDQLLMTRKVLSATESAETYYVYDEYNNLAFILPPKAADAIKALAPGTQLPGEILDNLCYQYRYDGRQNLTEKKLPNKGWEYFVYDRQDRLILTQDAALRTTGNNFSEQGWLFTKYDNFSRVAMTGFYKNAESRYTVQTSLNNLTATGPSNEIRVPSPNTVNGLNLYYRNLAFPSTGITLLTVNYYDTYPGDAPAVAATVLGQHTLQNSLDANNDGSTNDLRTAYHLKNIEANLWTTNYDYYDSKGRLISTKSFNHLGGYTHKELKLDFTGQVEKSITYHKRLSTDTEKLITETFEYDAQNRLLAHKHQVDSNPVEILAQNVYNELSQVVNKKVGGTSPSAPLQNIEQTYNIQGWMTKVNNPQNLSGKLFAYELKFNNPVNTSLSSPSYNGNIAEVDWVSPESNGVRRYSYQYDAMGRLKSGIYSEPGASLPENGFYNELLTYDLNGNIQTLQRFRNAPGIGQQRIDNLAYVYTGNRLDKVTDDSGNYFGYPDTSGTLITYDSNGNMKSQVDKGILQIDYNYLNLPKYVKFNKYISRRGQMYYVNTNYKYRADGVKLSKEHNYFKELNQSALSYTDYLDGFQYTNLLETLQIDGSFPMTLQFVPTAEGYYDYVQNKYFYQYKDQVGNIRLSYYKDGTGNAAIDRSTDYYPFGLEFGGNGLNIQTTQSPKYFYTFQGQEKQEETGWNSFKWRNYDPSFGRFFNVDPLSEDYAFQSHYNFSENRVVNGRELEGLEWVGMFTRVMPLMENTGVRPILEPLTKPEVIEGTVKTGRFSKEQLGHFDRGRKVEIEQINKMNEEGQSVVKNTKNYEATDPKTGKTGETRPDGFTEEGRPVEVKNVKNQGLTRQLRYQDNLVEGKKLILRINKNANLTKPLKNSGIEIQPYNVVPPVKIDNIKVNRNPSPKINPIPVKKDPCAGIAGCA
jgi:RHS repeat-associated protein